MRHVYFRAIGGLIWLTVAIVNLVSGVFAMSALYILLSVVFFYSAYATWKKEKGSRGGM